MNEVDYSYYPERGFQLQWLLSYLEAYKEHKGQGSDVTDREVEILYVQVNQFALVSRYSDGGFVRLSTAWFALKDDNK